MNPRQGVSDRCDDLRALLSAFVDGETTPEQTAWIEAHARVCAECRTRLERYRLIQRVFVTEAPDSAFESDREQEAFAAAVMERIRETPSRQPFRAQVIRWRVPVISAFAVAATILLALFLRPEEEPTPPRPRVPAVASRTVEPKPVARPDVEPIEALPESPLPRQASKRLPTPDEPPALAMVEKAMPPANDASPTAEAKPARGGVAFVQDFYAGQALRTERMSQPAEDDTLVASLKTKASLLRRRLTFPGDSVLARVTKVDLAETLARIAELTRDENDVEEALRFWAGERNAIASAIGDSATRIQIKRLESILQNRPTGARSE